MSGTLASKIQFSNLCHVFEEIKKAEASKKAPILEKFLKQCRALASEIKAKSPDANVSLFPILRLLLPDKDRERKAYNLKEKSLADLYIRLFCLKKQSSDGKQLLHYKVPTTKKLSGTDFAERVYWILRNRMQKDNTTYTVEQINLFLDDISGSNETNVRKDESFHLLIKRVNATELKWITRIILKDLKLGMGSKKIFYVFHPDALAMFDVSSDLRQLSDKLYDPTTRHRHNIEIFSHVKPMLLEKCKIEDIEKLFTKGEQYFVQPKYDGERSQMHMKDGEYKYFTRQSYDITNNPGYGKTSSSGFLSGKFSRLLNSNCKSIILDGELMGWHKERKMFGSMGMSFDVKKLSENSSHQPCFVAFDIIMYNDELLVNKPYEERLKLLETVITEEEGSLVLCKSVKVNNSARICEAFNESMRNKDEGIVLKRCNVTYKPNIRDNSGCYKIKAEYSSDLVNDVDLIILGGYYGEGKFTGLMKSFLMGVASPSEVPGNNPSNFFSVVSVSNGFTNEDLKGFHEKFRDLWIDECPSNVTPPRLEPPDKWIRPEHSIILTLRATELTRSNDYPTGYSLRFPRVMRIRFDKPWYTVCTTTELQSLIKDARPIQKLTKRAVTEDDIKEAPRPRMKKILRPRGLKVDNVIMETSIFDNPPVPITRLLDGKKFCVINGNDDNSKEQIEEILLSHRAKVVQNPSKDDCIVIIGNMKTIKANAILNAKKYDVVGVEWLNYVTEKDNWSSLQDFRPWDLLGASESTTQRMADNYDKYYDSFTMDADEESLKRSLEQANAEINKVNLNQRKIRKIDRLLFNADTSPYSLFRNIVGYFIDESDCAKYPFRFMAGTIADEINEITTHIFVNENFKDSTVYNVAKCKYKQSKRILNSDWIMECLKNGELISVTDYICID